MFERYERVKPCVNWVAGCIQQVFDVRKQGEPVCTLVKTLVDCKIATLEQEIQQATARKTMLETYRTSWAARPLDNPSNVRVCSLIEEVSLTSNL